MPSWLLIGLVASVGVAMIGVERRRPAHAWPRVPGWWARALALTVVQVATVVLVGRAWDPWLVAHRPWSGPHLGVLGNGLAGYTAVTFVYYWWHRARHASPLLWRWLHQVHHSPQRLEVVTAFYKHPFEVVANGILTSIVLYPAVGLDPISAGVAVLLTGLAELFYHWNVSTPRWLGWVIQRPESHRLHHEEGLHRYNYADLPVWDLLFGTLRNPRAWQGRCGFGGLERRLGSMLRGVDVTRGDVSRQNRGRLAASLLLAVGLSQMAGDLSGLPALRALAAATAAAPAPKVFSAVRGFETYSTRFTLEWSTVTGEDRQLPLTRDVYRRLRGPYNRRNVYGAVLAFGPVLPPTLREPVLTYGACGRAPLLREIGIDPATIAGSVRLRLEPRPGSALAPASRLIEVCP